MNLRASALFALIAAAAACGGSTAGAPAAPTSPTTPIATGPTTATFSGTTRQLSATGCAGDSHSITINEGAVSVTLVETTDPAGAMSVQLCPGGLDTGMCSLLQQKIKLGETVSGMRVGTPQQTLKLLPHACVFASTFDPTPIAYKVSITYQQ